MLAKNQRIRKKKDIERIFKKGKGHKEGLLILKTVKNDLSVSRFGFIVSQKVSKKANVRNKIKRRLREIIKLKINSFPVGTDNLFIALPGLEKKEFKNIKETIDSLLKK